MDYCLYLIKKKIVWCLIIDNWALGMRAKNDLVELIDHQTIASRSTIPNAQSNLYWISYMKFIV